MPSQEVAQQQIETQSSLSYDDDTYPLTLPPLPDARSTPPDLSPAALSQEVAAVLHWYRAHAEAILDSPKLISEQEQLLDILARVPAEISKHLMGSMRRPTGLNAGPNHPRLLTVHGAAIAKGCSRALLHRLIRKGKLGLQIAKTQLIWSHQLRALIVRQPGRPQGT